MEVPIRNQEILYSKILRNAKFIIMVQFCPYGRFMCAN